MRKISCIYFMFLRGHLVYVGSTKNLYQRMGDHPYLYQHDCLRWIECPEDKVKHYEARIIRKLKPWWNSHHNPNGPKEICGRTDICFKLKEPKWMYYYERIKHCTNQLKFGNNSPTEREYLELQIAKSKLDFDHYYKNYGFLKTCLDYQHIEDYLRNTPVKFKI